MKPDASQVTAEKGGGADSKDTPAADEDEGNLLLWLLHAPIDNGPSHLDNLFDFIAASPAHAPSLGKLGGSNHVLNKQVHERLPGLGFELTLSAVKKLCSEAIK